MINKKHWVHDSLFYHIYPFGFCDAPPRNDFASPAVPRLEKIAGWLDHIQGLGANALYLGPVFESTAHGYDTVDYYQVDRRLGSNKTLSDLSEEIHRRGMRLILDGVFNHVGRNFWAFYDLREQGSESPYSDWFHNLQFGEPNAFGDPFSYEGWDGHYDLVKLNLHNPDVKQHLLDAVKAWIDEFAIDGLRLDAADTVDMGFLKELSSFCHDIKPDFWLVGEIVHGDYRQWVNDDTLDSVTNYECYKGLYSSLNDDNYFEIAYALNRQFGEEGVYKDLPLYAFVDNHDVNRIASQLTDTVNLVPLHVLLFTMPGVPSIYYGSEWGIEGLRTDYSDAALRPSLDLTTPPPHSDLAQTIRQLAGIRHASRALKTGDYQQILVDHQQFVFMRRSESESVIVAINASDEPVPLEFKLPPGLGTHLVDILNGNETVPIHNDLVQIPAIPPYWAKILRVNQEPTDPSIESTSK